MLREILKGGAGHLSLLRVYYYDAPPYQFQNPDIRQHEFYRSRIEFLKHINRMPNYEWKQGRTEIRIDKKGNTRFEQKMVDVLLSVDMVQLSAARHISYAILIDGDSDFCAAIEAAKKNGVIVALLHGKKPHNALMDTVDERYEITEDFIRAVARE